MKPLKLILLVLVAINAKAQILTLPEHPYIVVIGTDSMQSETVVQKLPEHSVDTVRLWTYLFKDEKITLRFPQRIDTGWVENLLTGEMWQEIDTSDHLTINKVLDSLSRVQVIRLLTSDIKVLQHGNELEIRRISFKLLYPDGSEYNKDIAGTTIDQDDGLVENIRNSPPNSYLICDFIWFYKENHEQDGIDGAIGWKLK